MARFSKEQFFNIEVKVLRLGVPLPFTLHLYLPLNDHIVQLVRSGEIFDEELSAKFTQKNITVLFLNNADRENYNEYIKNISEDGRVDTAEDGSVPEQDADETSEREPQQDTIPEITAEAENIVEVAAKKPLSLGEGEGEEKPDVAEKVFDSSRRLELSQEPDFEKSSSKPDQVESSLPKSSEREGTAGNMFKPAKDTANAQKLFNDIMSEKNPEAAKALEEAKEIVHELVSSMPEPENQLADLLKLKKLGHSSYVSIYSVLMAIGIGIKDKTILQDIAVAAMLHDLGSAHSAAWTFLTPENSTTPQQKSAVKKHVSDVKLIFEGIGFKPSERIATMIDQHHEKFDGTGYPNGVKGFRFDDYSQIVAFADNIDTIARGFQDGKVKNLRESLAVLGQSEKDPNFPHFYKPELYAKLAKWIKNDQILNEVENATQTLDAVKESLQKAA